VQSFTNKRLHERRGGSSEGAGVDYEEGVRWLIKKWSWQMAVCSVYLIMCWSRSTGQPLTQFKLLLLKLASLDSSSFLSARIFKVPIPHHFASLTLHVSSIAVYSFSTHEHWHEPAQRMHHFLGVRFDDWFAAPSPSDRAEKIGTEMEAQRCILILLWPCRYLPATVITVAIIFMTTLVSTSTYRPFSLGVRKRDAIAWTSVGIVK